MVTLRRFLGFRLEYGGLFIGTYCLVINVLSVGLCIFEILAVRQYDCDEFVRIWNPSLYAKVRDAWCPYIQRVTFTVLSFNILYSLGIVCIGCLCVQGTTSRNHLRINPMRIFLTVYVAVSGVFAVLISLFVISSFWTDFIIFHFLFTFIYMAIITYALLVINSLYKMFKQEYENKIDKRIDP